MFRLEKFMNFKSGIHCLLKKEFKIEPNKLTKIVLKWDVVSANSLIQSTQRFEITSQIIFSILFWLSVCLFFLLSF